ncbi:NADPH-dependent FMN reductase family protein [Arthrobacter pigmenti]
MAERFTRRILLGAGLTGGVGLAAALAGCVPGAPVQSSRPSGEQSGVATKPGAKSLLVFFSRAGENYYYGDRRVLEVGNTEVLAGIINERINCDVYEIKAADPYPFSYDATVDRNSQEQEADARPGIANPLPDISQYGTVLLGSPVWNVRAPMIMSTFIEGVDLAGKRILPFVTYAVSGMGTVEEDYRNRLSESDVRSGLAVRGGLAVDGEIVSEAGQEIDTWLRDAQLVG